jgi:hypothetical protein
MLLCNNLHWDILWQKLLALCFLLMPIYIPMLLCCRSRVPQLYLFLADRMYAKRSFHTASCLYANRLIRSEAM